MIIFIINNSPLKVGENANKDKLEKPVKIVQWDNNQAATKLWKSIKNVLVIIADCRSLAKKYPGT